jgi:DNA-binding transcriptional LysR family regulator
MQMNNLAEELGVELFEREGRSVRPTPMATKLLPYAEKALETVDAMSFIAKDIKGDLDKKARICMVSTARNFGPHLIQSFQNAHPGIEVEVAIHNRGGTISALENRQVEVALMGRAPRRVDVVARRFAGHPYVLIASPDHPLSRFRSIKRSDLVAHKFLTREVGSGTRMVHDHFFTDHDLPLPNAQDMSSNANIKHAVMAGMGVAFISAHTIALEQQAGKLCVLDVEGMPENRDWYVVSLKGSVIGPAAQAFCDYVAAEGQNFMQEFFADLKT